MDNSLFFACPYCECEKFCKITDAGLAHISSLSLHKLDLSKCKNVTDAGLAHLSSLSLKTLNIRSCWQVTDAGLAHLSGSVSYASTEIGYQRV